MLDSNWTYVSATSRRAGLFRWHDASCHVPADPAAPPLPVLPLDLEFSPHVCLARLPLPGLALLLCQQHWVLKALQVRLPKCQREGVDGARVKSSFESCALRACPPRFSSSPCVARTSRTIASGGFVFPILYSAGFGIARTARLRDSLSTVRCRRALELRRLTARLRIVLHSHELPPCQDRCLLWTFECQPPTPRFHCAGSDGNGGQQNGAAPIVCRRARHYQRLPSLPALRRLCYREVDLRLDQSPDETWKGLLSNGLEPTKRFQGDRHEPQRNGAT